MECSVNNPGADWVDRYLDPHLRTRLPGRSELMCLQIGPDDDEEAQRLRDKGYRCVVLLGSLEPYRTWRWRQSPVVSRWSQTPFQEEAFDVIFTGWFGKLADSRRNYPLVAREFCRLVRPGGAMLLTMSNRWCPVDLIDRQLSVPGRAPAARASLKDLRTAFQGLPVSLELLNVAGHFRWGRLPGPLSLLAPVLDAYLRWSSNPLRPASYASGLNPMLILWVRRQ